MTKTRKIFSMLLAVLLITTAFSTTAYALTIPDFTWNQSDQSTKFLSSSQRTTSNGTLVFDGVAYSTSAGTFRMKLQKLTPSGAWLDVPNTAVIRAQNSSRTFHQREGVYVTGNYFKTTWTGLSTTTTYRVALERVYNPKNGVKFTRTRIDIR